MVRQRKSLIEKRGRKCENCGWAEVPEILHVHHIRPREFGGTDEGSNLLVLCPCCHAVAHKELRALGRNAAKREIGGMRCGRVG